jgi:hypothetical protein
MTAARDPLGPDAVDLERKEQVESRYWRYSSASAADPHTLESLTNSINKFTDASVFLTSLRPFRHVFAEARSAVEMGAGQGGRAS